MGQKAFGICSMLLTYTEAFIERRHEGNMNNLMVLLGRDRRGRWGIISECHDYLTRRFYYKIIKYKERVCVCGWGSS